MIRHMNISKEKLNLPQFQEEMEEIVFDYIDTSKKWDIAYSKLDELLNEAVAHFKDVVQNNGGLPPANTYWVLFLNIVSRLIYFHTLALKQSILEKGNLSQDTISHSFMTAVKCLPNSNRADNAELFEEIASKIDETNESKEELDQIAKQYGQNVKMNLEAFYEFCQLN